MSTDTLRSRSLFLFSTLLTVLLIGLITAVGRAERNHLTSTDVGGPITQDTTWTALGSPYIATSSVVVMPGVTLTIEPGVEVRFNAHRALVVNGTLDARGIEAQPIVFTANTDDPEPGYWGYIQFGNAFQPPTACGEPQCPTLQHVVVEYGGYTAGDSNQAAVDVQKALDVWIDRVIIRYNKNSGVMAFEANIHITNSEIAYNSYSGVVISSPDWDIHPGSIIIDGNQIHHNTYYGFGLPWTRGNGGITFHYAPCGSDHYVSNNIIEYNSTNQYGGGIYAHQNCWPDLLIIDNNIIRHNTAAAAGAIYLNFGTHRKVLQNNKIYGNMGYNLSGLSSVAMVNDGGSFLSVTGNVIADNISLPEDTPGGLSITGQTGITSAVTNNTIARNYGGGIYFDGGQTDSFIINNNTIAFNEARLVAGIYFNGYAPGGITKTITLQNNTIVGNVSQNGDEMTHTTICAYCLWSLGLPNHYLTNMMFNNIWDNQSPYALSYGLEQGSPNLNATQNWWGTTDQSEILDQIFDFFDDSAYAIVDFSNFLVAPNPDAPPSPPANLQVVVNDADFQLSWDANPESDITGYKVYYADRKGYPYEGNGANEGDSGLDVGSATSFTLSGLPANKYHYFTVTAYDQDGNESWHSLEARQAVGEVPFSNGDFELGNNGDWLEQNAKVILPSSALPPGVQPLSGDFTAMLGLADRHHHSLAQLFRVPADGAILRYRYIFWAMRSHINDLCRFGTVEIRINDEVVEDFNPYIAHPDSWQWAPNCADTIEHGWLTREIDLSAYAGQNILLDFSIDSVSGNVWILDDIELVPPGSPSPYQPQLTISNDTGAPGSYFRLDGVDFPPDSVVQLAVNGTSLQLEPWSSFTQTISSGYAPIVLVTAHNIPSGSYEVVVSAASASGSVSASTAFTIDPNADYHWESLNNSIEFFVPADLSAEPPAITSNFGNGAPGSHFALTATNFPPNSPATISVNGYFLTTIYTNDSGLASFILRTGASLPPGLYNVSLAVNPSASVAIRLEADAPVRPLTGEGPIIDVPDDIEPIEESFIYLPLVIR